MDTPTSRTAPESPIQRGLSLRELEKWDLRPYGNRWIVPVESTPAASFNAAV